MQHVVNQNAFIRRESLPKSPAFNIVVVYETLAAALRVKEMSDRLASDLLPACKLNCEFWRFDLLSHPSFSARAVTDASQADMVIVAARGDSDLIPEVKDWFSTWVPRRRPGHSALVALLEEDRTVPGQPPALCGYLQEVAALCGMDFFCQAGGWRPAELQYVVETVHRNPDTPFAALLGRTTNDKAAFRDWGINE
jgi:hypothetical protein